jgi:hypothetical protein
MLLLVKFDKHTLPLTSPLYLAIHEFSGAPSLQLHTKTGVSWTLDTPTSRSFHSKHKDRSFVPSEILHVKSNFALAFWTGANHMTRMNV